MPNVDTGHYFYTGLFPVDLRPTKRADGSITSHSHLLREELASLPNYSPDDRAALPSPFARCRRTHLARFAMLDTPAFNGRVQGDAIRSAIKGVNPLVHQPVDHLSRSWLIFVADTDADGDEDGSARDAWARGLWEVMEPELRALFRHCLGFRNVETAQDFAAYLAKGQVETTMSFNDYWIDTPKLPGVGSGAIKAMVGGGALLGGLAVAWLRWWPWHSPGGIDIGGILLVLLGALLGLALGAWLLYRRIMRTGARSWPAGWQADLPGVLKSLHVQRAFARFAIDQQGKGPDELHAAFGRFVADLRPADVEGPTQPAGVVP